jgi:hypothetical protein
LSKDFQGLLEEYDKMQLEDERSFGPCSIM